MGKQIKQIRLQDGSFYVDVSIETTIKVPDESCLASDRAIADALGEVLADELPRNIIDTGDRVKAADSIADYFYIYAVLNVEENEKETAEELEKQIKEEIASKRAEDEYDQAIEEEIHKYACNDTPGGSSPMCEYDVEALEQEAREYAFGQQTPAEEKEPVLVAEPNQKPY